MLRTLATIALLGGLAVGLLAPVAALVLSSTMGRDVLAISPHAPEIVSTNKDLWTEGEPVAELYGIPSDKPMRILFADPDKIVVPDEDKSLTLYKVDKEAGENPFQVQTAWFFVSLATPSALLVALVAFFVRRRSGGPRTPAAALTAALALVAVAFVGGCQSDGDQGKSEPGQSGRPRFIIGHSPKLVNVKFGAEGEIETVTGTSHDARGEVWWDEAARHGSAGSAITISFGVAALDTGSPERDEQLESALGARDHPRILFESNSVATAGGDRFAVTGDLTIKGVTRPVTVDALVRELDPPAVEAIGFGGRWLKLTGTLTVALADFGITSEVGDPWTVTVDIFAGTPPIE